MSIEKTTEFGATDQQKIRQTLNKTPGFSYTPGDYTGSLDGLLDFVGLMQQRMAALYEAKEVLERQVAGFESDQRALRRIFGTSR